MRDMNQELYEKETTGSLMTNELIAVQETVMVEEAIAYLRGSVKDKKNIHYVYVLDENEHLVGALSIRELLSADVEQRISSIMVSNIVSFRTDEDQEKAAAVFRHTDLVSIPVVAGRNQLVGVVHVEDILDVMEQEATEDFHKMAPVAKDLDGGLMDATIGLLYRKRIVWLIVLVFMNVFSGAGIAHFEDVIESNIALVFFLPLLVDSGGNAGAQSATLVIRALATGEVRIKDWFKMFLKEVSVSVLMGTTMALAVSTIGFWRGGIDIAVVVALTMVLIVIVGSLIGMSLPFIFRKLKFDPATASAPLITSICDVVGVLIYFGIASWYLTL